MSAAPSRWTEAGDAAARPPPLCVRTLVPRASASPPSACRCCSSPSCCTPWRRRALAGSPITKRALPIDFAKTDLFLDPATLRGPDAEQTVAGADLEARSRRPRPPTYGRGAREMFGDAAATSLTKAIVANPDILNGTAQPLASGRQQARHRRQGRGRRQVRAVGRTRSSNTSAAPDLQLPTS